ncbi:MAG: M67 family metallopeptidase, partial [SAR202 cluster bacterium]|nr:M67 family metallopeptidase [SAR202 cluster bacterium]
PHHAISGGILLRLPREFARHITEHAVSEDPNECCGILAGANGIVAHAYRITNTVKSPYRYLMDPQEFLDADRDAESKKMEFLAFYHSHTHSEAYPSATDVRMALESGWLDIHYVLVSLADKSNPEIRAFNIDQAGHITEDDLQIV